MFKQQRESDFNFWEEFETGNAIAGNRAVTAKIPASKESLIPGTSCHRHDIGKIELIADTSSIQMQQLLICAAVPKS